MRWFGALSGVEQVGRGGEWSEVVEGSCSSPSKLFLFW